MQVWMISDSQDIVSYQVNVILYSWKGTILNQQVYSDFLYVSESKMVTQFPVADFLKGNSPNDCFILLQAFDTDNNNALLSTNTQIVTGFQRSTLLDPRVKLSNFVQKTPTEFTFQVLAQNISPYTSIEFQKSSTCFGRFSDNNLWLFPNKPVTLSFYSWNNTCTPSQLSNQLNVRTIYGTTH